MTKNRIENFLGRFDNTFVLTPTSNKILTFLRQYLHGYDRE